MDHDPVAAQLLAYSPMPWGLQAPHLLGASMTHTDLLLIDLTQYATLAPAGAALAPARSDSWGALLRAASYSTGFGAFRLLVPSDAGPTALELHVVQNGKMMTVSVADTTGTIAELTSKKARVQAPDTAAGRRRRALARRALFLLGLITTASAALFKAFDGVGAMAKKGADQGISPHLRRGHYRRDPKGGPTVWVPPVIVNSRKLLKRMLTNEAVGGSVYVLVPDENLRRHLVALRSSQFVHSRRVSRDVVTRLVLEFELPLVVNRCAYALTQWALTTVLAEQAGAYNQPVGWVATLDEAFQLLEPVMLKLGWTPSLPT